MGIPRRRFPGGSVGQYFVIRPARDNGDSEQADMGLTEVEAFDLAQTLASRYGERIYIAKYAGHADPIEQQQQTKGIVPDAQR